MSERNPEDEYFKRIEHEQKAKLKAQQEREAATKAREHRRELHFHKCGKCGADMNTLTFRGVEIEQCPDCNAVLLDPGELEQLAGKDSTAMFSGLFSMFGGGRRQRTDETDEG